MLVAQAALGPERHRRRLHSAVYLAEQATALGVRISYLGSVANQQRRVEDLLKVIPGAVEGLEDQLLLLLVVAQVRRGRRLVAGLMEGLRERHQEPMVRQQQPTRQQAVQAAGAAQRAPDPAAQVEPVDRDS